MHEHVCFGLCMGACCELSPHRAKIRKLDENECVRDYQEEFQGGADGNETRSSLPFSAKAPIQFGAFRKGAFICNQWFVAFLRAPEF